MASDGRMWDYSTWVGQEPRPYGDAQTYEVGVPWLDLVCETIEDWGAGLAFAKQYVKRAQYVSVDSSPTAEPFVDVIENLEDRKSSPDGIFMRHILEHNANWPEILDNAVASFRKRMVLIMFTPFFHATAPTPGRDRLDICFAREDLVEHFEPFLIAELDMITNTQYGREHLFFLTKEEGDEFRAAAKAAEALGAELPVLA